MDGRNKIKYLIQKAKEVKHIPVATISCLSAILAV